VEFCDQANRPLSMTPIPTSIFKVRFIVFIFSVVIVFVAVLVLVAILIGRDYVALYSP